jgi:hypothetical protein
VLYAGSQTPPHLYANLGVLADGHPTSAGPYHLSLLLSEGPDKEALPARVFMREHPSASASVGYLSNASEEGFILFRCDLCLLFVIHI